MNLRSRLAALAASLAVVVGAGLGTAPAASAGTGPDAKFTSSLSADQVRPGPGDPTWAGAAQILLYDDRKTWAIRGAWVCPGLENAYTDDNPSQYATGCPVSSVRLAMYHADGSYRGSWDMLAGATTFNATITTPTYYKLLREHPERFRFIIGTQQYPSSGGQGGIIAGAIKRPPTSGVAG